MRYTPLYQEHLNLAANMVEFGGWEMPLSYTTGIFEEHLATRKFCSLFDISHMGRLLISGQDTLPFLQYVLTNNVAALEPGQAHYTIISNENGAAVDDVYLYQINYAQYLLVINAANIQKDWQWLLEHKDRFSTVVIEDFTDTIAMLALQGPRSKVVLEALLGGDGLILPGPAKNTITTVKILDKEMPIARTGYAGEPIGFELFPPAEIAVSLWNSLLEAGAREGISPAGLGARDTLRLEANLPLYGHELGSDLEEKAIPIFSGRLARNCVSFSKGKGGYVGREALVSQFDEVKARLEGRLDKPQEKPLVPRMIMPVAVLGEGIARTGYEVYIGEISVGNVTSGTVVPYWRMEGYGVTSKPSEQSGKRAICLAYLDADLREGQGVQIQIRNRRVPAVIADRHLGSEAAPFARPMLVER